MFGKDETSLRESSASRFTTLFGVDESCIDFAV